MTLTDSIMPRTNGKLEKLSEKGFFDLTAPRLYMRAQTYMKLRQGVLKGKLRYKSYVPCLEAGFMAEWDYWKLIISMETPEGRVVLKNRKPGAPSEEILPYDMFLVIAESMLKE